MTPYPNQAASQTQARMASRPLALVPFIDMLTILVVFLLVHTADVDILPNTKNIPFRSPSPRREAHARRWWS